MPVLNLILMVPQKLPINILNKFCGTSFEKYSIPFIFQIFYYKIIDKLGVFPV